MRYLDLDDVIDDVKFLLFLWVVAIIIFSAIGLMAFSVKALEVWVIDRPACIYFAKIDEVNTYQFNFWAGCMVTLEDGTIATAEDYLTRFNRLKLEE